MRPYLRVVRSCSLSLLALTAVAVSVPYDRAEAAAVSPQAGSVFVNPGDGFFHVERPTYVAPGSKILVSEGGSAYLAFSAACATTIEGPRTIEVPPTPPCAAGQSSPPAGWDQAGTVTAGQTGSAASGIGTETLVIGGLVIAGGAGAAIGLSGGGGGKPASP